MCRLASKSTLFKKILNYQAQLDMLQQFAEAKKPATDLINRLKTILAVLFKRIIYG